MQKKVVYVLISMTICVLGITGLQLYWNYQNYRNTVASFKKDADEALDVAVNQELLKRRMGIVSTFKGWMADTTILKITCDTANREHETAFTITDAVPYYAGEKADQRTMGISSFKEKLGRITPRAKTIFINHFAKIVEDDLRDGATYYYTQGLGHRLEKTFNSSKLDLPTLAKFYKRELAKKRISSKFKLHTDTNQVQQGFLTHKTNAAFRRPYRKEMVWASIETPHAYYLREMKWLIISSALLIGITLFCFYYTVKTLLNQYKLVAIKNQFISSMTHEINTPLSSIQITTEALQQFNYDEETKMRYLDIILYQTHKLTDLSAEILENAKLETLAFSRDEKVNLKEMLLGLIEEIKNLQQIEVTYQLPVEEVIIRGNSKHLSRSIMNVFDNASKYNHADRPVIEVKLQQSAHGVQLSIKDNGLGISDEYKDKIFDQFYRIPTGDIHDIKGYGLGLNYVKKVILQHRGVIRVTDNYPVGTEFTISLPI